MKNFSIEYCESAPGRELSGHYAVSSVDDLDDFIGALVLAREFFPDHENTSGESRERPMVETSAQMPASETSKPEAPPTDMEPARAPSGTAATYTPGRSGKAREAPGGIADQGVQPAARTPSSHEASVAQARERKRFVAELWPQGVPSREIAKRLGTHHSRVSQIAREFGLPGRPKGWPFKQNTEAPTSTADQLSEKPGHLGPATAKASEMPAAEPTAGGEVENPDETGASASPEIQSPAVGSRTTSGATAPGDGVGKPVSISGTPPANGKFVALKDGVLVKSDNIECDGKALAVTPYQRVAVATLLKAAPHPVGAKFLQDRVYPSGPLAERQAKFSALCGRLRELLPTIGLELKEIKGVGVALGRTET